MRALIQRVTHAEVTIAGERVGAINRGVLALIGVEKDDDVPDADRLIDRVLTYRIFPDGEGRMNLSLADIGGGLLLVPQFTLAADTRKGTRAGFSTAAPPDRARALFDHLSTLAEARHGALGRALAFGRFGADMQVSLTNDGPVTFLL